MRTAPPSARRLCLPIRSLSLSARRKSAERRCRGRGANSAGAGMQRVESLDRARESIEVFLYPIVSI